MSPESPFRDGAPAGFALIETLRWEPGTGFLRLDRHLARLRASAEALGFAADPERIGKALRDATGMQVPLRVRLTLAENGDVDCVTQPFEPTRLGTVWRLGLARTRIDSADPLTRHKTTLRATYDAARAEIAREDADEVLLLNERGEVCDATITTLFVDRGDGPLATPALACGLLDGVLRAELIDAGKATEAILGLADLRTARKLLVGNSLRGLIEARLV